MNILTDVLPYRVRVGASTFEVETSFKAGISFSLMVEAGENDLRKLCAPFFPHGLPQDIAGAVEAMLFIYRGGETTEESAPQKTAQEYSFSVDSEAIFADFWRYYNVDLTTENLHWWTFRGLLMGLPEDSNFKMRIYYRTCKLNELPKKERQRIANIRKRIEIKRADAGKLTLEQRNKQMIDYVERRSKEMRG